MLEGVKDIAICKLTSADVVRHALVQEIINAYEKAEKKKENERPAQQFQGRYQRKKEYGKEDPDRVPRRGDMLPSVQQNDRDR